MNEDRIVGAGKELLGKGERTVGEATGSERLQGDGLVDQVTGAVQHGYGKVEDVVGDVLEDAPGAAVHAAERGRALGRQADEAIRGKLGESGSLWLIGGAVALLALGAFALTRSAPAQAPKPSSAPKPKPAPRRKAKAPAKPSQH